jgi:hypothetical protein
MIRDDYKNLFRDRMNGNDGQTHADHHVQHCFSFLSQSIMCAGDLTIEWARIESDGSRFQVDGWGIPHQCKDPNAIFAWMEENHGPLRSKISHIPK